jgi:hypothetical protein
MLKHTLSRFTAPPRLAPAKELTVCDDVTWLLSIIATTLFDVAVTIAGQLSTTTGAVYVTTAEHWPASALTVTGDGHVIPGASPSTTVTTCEQLALLPFTSVAVHTTVVLPKGNVEGALPVTDNIVQLSVAVGGVNNDEDTLQVPTVAFMLTGEQLITGNSLSVTTTVKLQLLELPEASVAVKVLVVVPTGNEEPLANPAV